MLALESGAMLCRPCAGKVSAFLRGAPPTFLNGLWSAAMPTHTRRQPRRHEPPTASDAQLIADFQAGLMKVIRPEDFKAHWDLGMAYAEMGLSADAIPEIATSLDERAPDDMAHGALEFIFGPPRARPDALDSVVAALRHRS